MSNKVGTCRACGEEYTTGWYKHNHDKHGYKSGKHKKPLPGDEKTRILATAFDSEIAKIEGKQCPLIRLSQLKKEIEDTIKSLEHDRDQMHKRVLEMDTTIAKYKRMLITNQHD